MSPDSLRRLGGLLWHALAVVPVAALAIGVFAHAAATPAQAAPFAYVTNLASVSQYEVGAGGLLAPLSPPTVATVPDAIWLAVSPNGQNVYVTSVTGDTVSQYDVGQSGTLSPKSPATVATGDVPEGVTVSPNGESAYVVDAGSSDVFQYDVGPGGGLQAKSPARVAVPTGAGGDVVVSPDGRSVYVGGSGISQFDVGAGGELSPKSPANVGAGTAAGDIALSPDGRSVYATDGERSVAQYDVGPDGRLSPKSPATVAAGDFPQGLAVSPDGRSVYVANVTNVVSVVPGDVSQYDVGPGGVLSPKSPATVAAGNNPEGVAVSPGGGGVYVTNSGSNSVSQYDIGPGGELAPKSPATVAAGFGPRRVEVGSLPRMPTTKAQCKRSGWRQFGFRNQGRCIRFVKHGPRA